MPELGEYSRHLQGVDTQILQRSSNQGWALLCYNCRTGVKSGIYNRCHACLELLQDVKPGDGQSKHHPLLQGDNGGDIGWRSTDLIPPAPAPVTPLLPAQEVDIAIVANNSPFGPSPVVKRVTRARSSSSDERNHARSSPRRSSTSPYLHSRPQRGRPPNGSRVGPMGFRGVRQRRNVRGYLVEIRPPKWKKTIWLGTYDSDREAAGAYDAGIFYTHKKTKYNFPILAGTFPALPPQLRLDNVDDSDEIKTFVQSQAREAARKVNAMSTTPRTDADRRGLIEDTTRASRDNHHPSASSNFPVSSATSGIPCAMSSSPCATSSSQNVSVSSATSSTEESAVSDHEIGSLLVDDEWSLLQQIFPSTTWDLVCHPWDSFT